MPTISAALRTISALTAILLLTACGTPDYDSWRTDIEAKPTGENLYHINVTMSGIANMAKLRRASEEYALIKAAQTAVEQGKSEFVVWNGEFHGVTYGNGKRVIETDMDIEVDDGPHDAAKQGKRFKAQEVLDLFGTKHLQKE